MSNQQLVIVSCHDPLMWYASRVGSVVPLLRDLSNEDAFLTREPAGWANIVKHRDVRRLPLGYRVLEADERMQHGDLVVGDLMWQSAPLHQIGCTVDGRVVIRQAAQGPHP